MKVLNPNLLSHFSCSTLYSTNKSLPLGTGPLIDILAGSAAGGNAVLCTYPLDPARTKLAYQVYILHNNDETYGLISE